jgi:hypothetical protein
MIRFRNVGKGPRVRGKSAECGEGTYVLTERPQNWRPSQWSDAP